MSLVLRRVAVGPALTVATIVCNGDCSFERAVKALRKSNPRALEKLMATLEIAARLGLDALDSAKFRALGGGLYEFKERSAGVRLFCFYDVHRRKLILLHRTWIKAGKDKRQSAEIESARNEMLELKEAGPLPFDDGRNEP